MSQPSAKSDFESKLSELEARFQSIPGTGEGHKEQGEKVFTDCVNLLGDYKTLWSEERSKNSIKAETAETLGTKVSEKLSFHTDVPEALVTPLAHFSATPAEFDAAYIGRLYDTFQNAYGADQSSTQDELKATIQRLERVIRDCKVLNFQAAQQDKGSLVDGLYEFQDKVEDYVSRLKSWVLARSD